MELKRGDTLTLIVRRLDDLGNPLTGQALELRSQVRRADSVLVAEFEIVETATPGSYLFTIGADITKSFPVGNLYFDIEHNDAGIITSSITVVIVVEKDVTY